MRTFKRIVTNFLEYSLGIGLCLFPIPISFIYGMPLFMLIPITGIGILVVTHAAWTIMSTEGCEVK